MRSRHLRARVEILEADMRADRERVGSGRRRPTRPNDSRELRRVRPEGNPARDARVRDVQVRPAPRARARGQARPTPGAQGAEVINRSNIPDRDPDPNLREQFPQEVLDLFLDRDRNLHPYYSKMFIGYHGQHDQEFGI